MTSIEEEARTYAEKRFPLYVAPAWEEDVMPSVDASWQDAETEMERRAFEAGYIAAASRQPSEAEHDRALRALALIEGLAQVKAHPTENVLRLWQIAETVRRWGTTAPTEPRDEPSEAEVEAADLAIQGFWGERYPSGSLTTEIVRTALEAARTARGEQHG